MNLFEQEKAHQEAFLDFLTEADKFEEDVDVDTVDGRSIDCTTYHLTVSRSVLETFCEALGLKRARYDETVKEMLDRLLTL